jgi:hypothetical protein
MVTAVERHTDEISRIVRDLLTRDFDHIKIIDVKVHRAVDSDDAAVLRIDVIFEGAPKDLNTKKLAGVGRILQTRLNDMHESAMPLLSFISGADWQNRNKRAPA